MDEYLFIALAKLKADLRRFERVRTDKADSQADEPSTPAVRSRLARNASASPDVLAVVSTHGLRGWN